MINTSLVLLKGHLVYKIRLFTLPPTSPPIYAEVFTWQNLIITIKFIWLKICESDTIVTMLSTMDRAGNILMALMYRTTLYKFNDTIQNTDHLGDIIIMKIDSAGNEIFNKSISGPCFETINSIITDDNNNVFFTGQLDQNLNNCPTDFDGVPVLNDTLVYLAKMDSNGMYLWIKKYNVGVIDRIYTYDDNIYCHGRCTLTNNDIGGIGSQLSG